MKLNKETELVRLGQTYGLQERLNPTWGWETKRCPNHGRKCTSVCQAFRVGTADTKGGLSVTFSCGFIDYKTFDEEGKQI